MMDKDKFASDVRSLLDQVNSHLTAARDKEWLKIAENLAGILALLDGTYAET